MNTKERFIFTASDGANLSALKWTVDSPTLNLLIIHGMAEHCQRYDDVANYLNSFNINVYSLDLRGHGKSIENNLPGYFADKNGWKKIISDISEYTKFIKSKNENLPLYIMGHSMGSIIARSCIGSFGNEYAGCILSGVTIGTPPFRIFGIAASSMFSFFSGKKKKGSALDNITFGAYDKAIKDSDTKFCWLSRDSEQVGKYNDDPLCGFVCTNSMFNDLSKLLYFSMKKNTLKSIPKNLPIYIISGKNDPVGANGKEPHKLYTILKKLGIKNVSYKLYPEARHEIINETNNKEVYDDIYSWLTRK